MRPDIVPGGTFPDFALPDHTGTRRRLSQLQGDDPLVLLLSRGHYCPKEHQHHLHLAAFQSQVAVAYTQMVTIATDDHHELQGRDPLILMLSRGHYCPKEHQQHHDLAAFQSKVAVAYTQMVTIATDDHHTLQEFRLSVGAQWTFLSYPDRTVQRDLDIQ